jgi:phenylacetate-coenzyme A ligase PaaK-like adenylate-forming protein
MDHRRRLFFYKHPYDKAATKDLFMKAVRDNLRFHLQNCADYARMADSQGFCVEGLQSEDDLYKIPVIPTLFLKRNRLFSMPEEKLTIKATSSGTQGAQSIVGFDLRSLLYGIVMMLRFFSFHHVISILPTNYIVLGYEPSAHTQMGAIKTAYGTTKFAPAMHREYALKDTGTGYALNITGLQKALMRYARQGFPVRFVGFPSHMYFLARELEQHGIRLKLNRHSKILLGGGWKQFSDEEIDRDSFHQLIYETLGIEKEHCLEFFSAVEHPLPYLKCPNGHFHVPIYSRVIIRDVKTFDPLPKGHLGLLNFVSPLVWSMPITSVVTDDLAILYDGDRCGCGIGTPFFDLHGRAGVRQIRTCTTDAAALLEGDR